MIRSNILLIIFMMSTVNTANADVVTINFLAEVEYVDATQCQCVPSGSILPGDTLRGSYVYSLSSPDLDPSRHRGVYEYVNMPNGIFVYHDDYYFGTDENDVLFRIFITDSVDTYGSLNDRFRGESRHNTLDPFYTGEIEIITIDYHDLTATALDSDSLPTSAPTLNQWDFATLVIYGNNFGYVVYSNIIWVGFGQPPTHIEQFYPQTVTLSQNVPNPFNPSTTIYYSIDSHSPVTLVVYDLYGKKVRTLFDGHREAGSQHMTNWDGTDDSGRDVASGVYFYKLASRNGTRTKKMILLK